MALAYLPVDASVSERVEALKAVRDTGPESNERLPALALTTARVLRAAFAHEIEQRHEAPRRMTLPADRRPKRGEWRAPRGQVEGLYIDAKLYVEEMNASRLEVRYLPLRTDAVLTLLKLFLADRNLGIGLNLRRCKYEECGRAFIARANKAGGPRRKYCSAEHQQLADRKAAVERAALWRKQTAPKE